MPPDVTPPTLLELCPMTPKSWHDANRKALGLPPDWGRGRRDVPRHYLAAREMELALDTFRRAVARCTCGLMWFTTHGYHRTEPPFDPIEKCAKHGLKPEEGAPEHV